MCYYATDCQTNNKIQMWRKNVVKDKTLPFFFLLCFKSSAYIQPKGSSLNCNVFVTKNKTGALNAKNIQYKISEQCIRNRKQWTFTLITYWKLCKIEQFESDPVFIYVVELLACVPLSFSCSAYGIFKYRIRKKK